MNQKLLYKLGVKGYFSCLALDKFKESVFEIYPFVELLASPTINVACLSLIEGGMHSKMTNSFYPLVKTISRDLKI